MSVWYLIVVFLHGDFTMVPFITEYACLEAEANVPVELVEQSQCQPVWLDWPMEGAAAPQFAPMPVPRKE